MTTSSIRFMAVAMGLLMVLTAGFAGPADAFTYDNFAGATFGSEVSTVGGGGGAGKGISFFGPIGEGAPLIPGDQYGTIGWGNQPGASFTTATDPFTQTGTGAGARSALRIEGKAGVINPGDTVPVALVTHANREIFLPFLTHVDLDSRLRIFDGVTPVLTDFLTNSVDLTETPNLGSAAECDPVTQIPATAPCSDYFSFPVGVFAPLGFSSGGNSYVVTFSLVPLAGAIVEPVDCADPGGPADPDGLCVRVRTAELDTNQFRVDMTLTQLDVPGPASLVLLGLSLVGLGAAGRIGRRDR
jgi:hypothetical protein